MCRPAVSRGKILVETGASGKSVSARSVGEAMKVGNVPRLAGLHPIHGPTASSVQDGTRNGIDAQLMKKAVAPLTDNDVLGSRVSRFADAALHRYTPSLGPSNFHFVHTRSKIGPHDRPGVSALLLLRPGRTHLPGRLGSRVRKRVQQHDLLGLLVIAVFAWLGVGG
jgi:hypothetical protein